LRSFQAATIIYDATVSFSARFMDKRSRTVDQMVQAARSGRQNIAEGSRASAISSQTELRLVNVARASLDELLLDYEDFLRQRGQRLWTKDDPQALVVRGLGSAKSACQANPSDQTDRSDRTGSELYAAWLNHADPAVVANAIICLIHQTNYLLDRQINGLERHFIQEGGYSENLAAARRAELRIQAQNTRPEQPTPACPSCGGPMVPRSARSGKNAGSRFWGCRSYPDCRGTRPLELTSE
jgi:restriction system protein